MLLNASSAVTSGSGDAVYSAPLPATYHLIHQGISSLLSVFIKTGHRQPGSWSRICLYFILGKGAHPEGVLDGWSHLAGTDGTTIAGWAAWE